MLFEKIIPFSVHHHSSADEHAPMSSADRRAHKAKVQFNPTSSTEMLKVIRQNQDKVGLVDTKNSPSLERDVKYFFETNKVRMSRRIYQGLRWIFPFLKMVKSENYLTYHKEKDSITGENRLIGDVILQVTIFFTRSWRHPLAVFVSDIEVGGTKHSKKFLQEEGYVPVERFIGEKRPKWIIIGAGSNPELMTKQVVLPVENGDLPETYDEQYLVIPGKMNFRTFDWHGIKKYRTCLVPANEFLKAHKQLRTMARENNVESIMLNSENLMVLERQDVSPRELIRDMRSAIKRHRDIAFYMAGNFIHSFGSGLQQGALMFLVSHMMENVFKIVSSIMFFFQYVYPNFLTIPEIVSAVKFDDIKEAVKGESVDEGLIAYNLKKIQLRAAMSYTTASFLFVGLYPQFFLSLFGTGMLATGLFCVLYFMVSLLKDTPLSFEQDNSYQIFKRVLRHDKELKFKLLKIRAMSEAISIVLNVSGLFIGWFVMSTSHVAGLIVAGIGTLGALGKFLYPYYGRSHKVRVQMNVAPFRRDEYEVDLIPGKVRIIGREAMPFYVAGKKRFIYDPQELKVLLTTPGENMPKIHKYGRRPFSNVYRSWTLTWPQEKVYVRISLKEQFSKLELVPFEKDGMVAGWNLIEE